MFRLTDCIVIMMKMSFFLEFVSPDVLRKLDDSRSEVCCSHSLFYTW